MERTGIALLQPLSLGAALLLGRGLFRILEPGQRALGVSATVLLFLTIGFWLLVMDCSKRATRRLMRSLVSDLKLGWSAVTLGAVTAMLIAPLLEPDRVPSQLLGRMLLEASPALALLPLARQLQSWAGHQTTERIIIVGSGQVADAVARRLAHHHGIALVGTVDDYSSESSVGGLAELVDLCEQQQVDRVLVTFSRTPSHQTVDRLRELDPRISISVVPRMFELVNWSTGIEELDGLPLLHVPRPRMTASGRVAKRALDLVVACSVLLILSPLLALLAVAIKVDSPGPVFFRQPRIGWRGGIFLITKLRTMRDDAESQRARLAERNEVNGPIFKIHDDPRVTRIGRWLRRTSLDELPQLFNVIKGDMSLVGPRPFPVDEAAQIRDWPVPRTGVRPGITGLWQVSGRSDLSFEDLRYLDSIYVASWSIWWDLRILLQTPAHVLRREGAY